MTLWSPLGLPLPHPLQVLPHDPQSILSAIVGVYMRRDRPQADLGASRRERRVRAQTSGLPDRSKSPLSGSESFMSGEQVRY